MAKPFTMTGSVLLALVALGHLVRAVAGFEIVIAGTLIPIWVSATAGLLVGGLAWRMSREARV